MKKRKVRITGRKMLNGGNTNRKINSTNRDESNVEVEVDESIVMPGENGVPESYMAGGKKHSGGGTPLNLPKGSFVFSNNKKKLKITDKSILAEFGETSKKRLKGLTPAELAKKYDINKYRAVLDNEHAGKLQKETAKKMITNYNLKLSKLALIQESMKGFPQGAPEMTQPYMMKAGITADDIMPKEEEVVTDNVEAPEMEDGGALQKMDKGGTLKEKRENRKKEKAYQEQRKIDVSKEEARLKGLADKKKLDDDKAEQVLTANVKRAKTNPVYDESSDKYDPSKVKVGDFIKRENGKVYEKTKMSSKGTQYEGDMEGWEGKAGERYSNQYATVAKAFDSPEARKAFAKHYRTVALDDASYVGKNGKSSDKLDKQTILDMSDDDIVEIYLRHQERNLKLAANEIDPLHFNDRNGKIKKEHKDKYSFDNLDDAFKSIGMEWESDANDPSVITNSKKLEQASYVAANSMLSEEGREGMSPELLENFKALNIAAVGNDDEKLGFKNTSPIDGYYTDTSAGQNTLADDSYGAEYKAYEEEEKKEEKEEEEEVVVDENTPWYSQDVGNAYSRLNERMNLKKYLPNSTPIDLEDPDVVYYDPSRALAANAESSAVASKTNAMFAGAQGTFRNSGVASNAAKNAADIMGAYEDKNVSLANNYLDKVQDTANKEHLSNAARVQKDYDGQTVANQQFDNSKTEANRNMFLAWRDGKTNQQTAQTLNSLYPEYNIRPEKGGGVYFNGSTKDLTDNGTVAPSAVTLKTIQRDNPGLSASDAIKLLKVTLGQEPSGTSQSEADNRAQAAQMITGVQNQQAMDGLDIMDMGGVFNPSLYKS